MTGEELRKIIEARLNKVVEDAIEEYGKDWKIDAYNDCQELTFFVDVEKRIETIDQFTKEELFEIVKKTLFEVSRRVDAYDATIKKLYDKEYALKNKEELSKICFYTLLNTSREYMHQLRACFSRVSISLLNNNRLDEILQPRLDKDSIDPIKFLSGRQYGDV